MEPTAFLVEKEFDREGGHCLIKNISEQLDIPIALVEKLMQELIESGIVPETKPFIKNASSSNGSETCYQTAFDIAKMTIAQVIRMWEEHGNHHIQFGRSEEVLKISQKMYHLYDIIEQSTDNSPLKSI